MTQRPGTRPLIVGLVTALAVGLGACTSAPTAEPTAAPPPVAGATSQASAPLSEKDAYIAEGPPILDPAHYEHGQFVGAIDIEYRGERTSAEAKEADAKYAAYFKGNYTPPQAGEHNAIRLNAMGDPRDGDRLLFLGAIVDNITLPNEIVLGLHNITRIQGGVELNGEVYEGRVAGANGTMVVGDRLSVWVPDPTYPDLVDRYTYEVVPGDSGGDYTVVDVGPGYEDIIYKPPPGDDVYQLSLYTCWPPNQSIRRLVTRLHLVEAAVEPGTVKPVG